MEPAYQGCFANAEEPSTGSGGAPAGAAGSGVPMQGATATAPWGAAPFGRAAWGSAAARARGGQPGLVPRLSPRLPPRCRPARLPSQKQQLEYLQSPPLRTVALPRVRCALRTLALLTVTAGHSRYVASTAPVCTHHHVPADRWPPSSAIAGSGGHSVR